MSCVDILPRGSAHETRTTLRVSYFVLYIMYCVKRKHIAFPSEKSFSCRVCLVVVEASVHNSIVPYPDLNYLPDKHRKFSTVRNDDF